MTGPAATPMPTTAPQTPRAAARSRRSRNVLVMMDRVVGKITAAAVPMATRAAISAPEESTSRADGTGRGEAEQAEDQRGPAAVAVGEAAGREHEGREREVVAVDDPLQGPGAGVEVGGDARQRDVDDRGVEVDGKHGRTDRQQNG